MPALHRTLLAAGLFAALSPTAAPAQERDAFVLPPGMVRLRLGGVYAGYDARFGPTGGREGPGAALERPLDATRFAPLAPLQQGLQRLLAQEGVPVGPETLTLGTPSIRIYDNVVRAPLSLSLGLLSRLEVGAELSLVRAERLVQRLAFAEGTVGQNPDTVANRLAFGRIGAEWEALGRSRLLPTDSSVLGRALQARARAAGTTLQLPGSPVDAAAFNALLASEFGLRPLASAVEEWRPGDLEVSARALLLSTFGTRPFPADSAGLSFRATASAALRLPTGSRPDSVLLIPLTPGEGYGGFAAGIEADVFVGRSFWGSAGVRYRSFQAADVVRRVAPAADPLAGIGTVEVVGRTPGDELEISILPRVRLAEAISFGGTYQYLWLGASSFAASSSSLSAPTDAAGSVQRLGLAARFTTLPGYLRGETGIPAEARFAWDLALTGPMGYPAANRISAELSVMPRLWGTR